MVVPDRDARLRPPPLGAPPPRCTPCPPRSPPSSTAPAAPGSGQRPPPHGRRPRSATRCSGRASTSRPGGRRRRARRAGRLAIDTEMMDQVRRISEAVQPHYTFLVIDAMTGQDAVATAEAFHSTLALDGVILTKLDGDARGGAALSVKEVVGRPIAFASTGEKLEDFDAFHPDRMAGRILGMGDVLTLIEKAEAVYEEEEAEIAAQKLMEGQFTL